MSSCLWLLCCFTWFFALQDICFNKSIIPFSTRALIHHLSYFPPHLLALLLLLLRQFRFSGWLMTSSLMTLASVSIQMSNTASFYGKEEFLFLLNAINDGKRDTSEHPISNFCLAYQKSMKVTAASRITGKFVANSLVMIWSIYNVLTLWNISWERSSSYENWFYYFGPAVGQWSGCLMKV